MVMVVVKQPEIEHKVLMRDFENWLEGSLTGGNEPEDASAPTVRSIASSNFWNGRPTVDYVTRASPASVTTRTPAKWSAKTTLYLIDGMSRISVRMASNSLDERTVPSRLRFSSARSSRSVTW